jgi:hypothetical protein
MEFVANGSDSEVGYQSWRVGGYRKHRAVGGVYPWALTLNVVSVS